VKLALIPEKVSEKGYFSGEGQDAGALWSQGPGSPAHLCSLIVRELFHTKSGILPGPFLSKRGYLLPTPSPEAVNVGVQHSPGQFFLPAVCKSVPLMKIRGRKKSPNPVTLLLLARLTVPQKHLSGKLEWEL